MERILVLESAEEAGNGLAGKLRAEGFEVLVASDLSIGGRLAAEGAVDVVVVNGVLAGRDGCDVLRRLRDDSPGSRAFIVQIVEPSNAYDVALLLHAGADDCLERPLDWTGFVTLLRTRIRRVQEVRAGLSRELDRTRQRVVRALSHEVFYPLLEIEAGSEYLANRQRCPQYAISDTAQDIVEASHRLHQMLGKLMLAATLEETATAGAQGPPAATMPLDVAPVVERAAVQTARRNDRLEDVTLYLEAAQARIAPVDLERIVQELMGEAFAVSSPGMAVTVSTLPGDPVRIAVAAAYAGGDAVPALTEPLAAQRATGLHIGLEIARRLAALHGGSVFVDESALDAEFYAVVTLPDEAGRALSPDPRRLTYFIDRKEADDAQSKRSDSPAS